MESANLMYVEKSFPLAEKLQTTLKNNFGALAQNVDFNEAFDEARLNINKWVEKFTHSKSKDLLPEGM